MEPEGVRVDGLIAFVADAGELAQGLELALAVAAALRRVSVVVCALVGHAVSIIQEGAPGASAGEARARAHALAEVAQLPADVVLARRANREGAAVADALAIDGLEIATAVGAVVAGGHAGGVLEARPHPATDGDLAAAVLREAAVADALSGGEEKEPVLARAAVLPAGAHAGPSDGPPADGGGLSRLTRAVHAAGRGAGPDRVATVLHLGGRVPRLGALAGVEVGVCLLRAGAHAAADGQRPVGLRRIALLRHARAVHRHERRAAQARR